MTTTLAINTVGDSAKIQLIINRKIIDSCSWPRDHQLAIKLLTAIDVLIKKYNLKLAEIEQLTTTASDTYLSSARTGYIVASILSVTAQIPLLVKYNPHSGQDS